MARIGSFDPELNSTAWFESGVEDWWYADELIDVSAAAADIIVATPADALGSYNDGTVSAARALSANLTADDLESYVDQPTVFRQGTLTAAPLSDSLGTYSDTPLNAQLRHSVAQTDNLNAWLDTPAATVLGSLAVAPPADSLNSWFDSVKGIFALQVAPPADAMAGADSLSCFVYYRTQFTDNLNAWADQISVQTTAVFPLTVAPPADANAIYGDQFDAIKTGTILINPDDLNLWADTLACINGLRAVLADAMSQGDLVMVATGAGALTVSVIDPLNNWADSVSIQTTALLPLTAAPPADSLNNWLDSTTGIRGLLAAPVADSLNNWTDAIGNILGLLAQPPTDAMVAVDLLSSFVRYLAQFVDDAEQYADQTSVQTTGLLPLTAAPAADSLGIYADSFSAQFRYSISQTDNLNAWADAIASTVIGLLTVAPGADSLNNWADSISDIDEGLRAAPPADAMAAADSIAGFVPYFAQLIDPANNWADQASVQTTAVSPLTASFTDPANNWADTATGREGQFAGLLDDAEQYADTVAGLQSLLAKPSTDALAAYLDSVDGGKATALTVVFTDPLSIYADTLARSQDRLAGLTDPLPIPADQLAARLGLMFSAIEPLSTPIDSAVAVLALRYALTDSALAIADLVDCRVGLFNEVRVALSDNLNQWLDSAAYTRQYFALKVSGELDDQPIDLTGEVMTEQIALNGKTADNQPIALTGRVSDRITLTGKAIQTSTIAGELYVGET